MNAPVPQEIWQIMFDNGHKSNLERMDTHRRAVDQRKKAFSYESSKKGDYPYEEQNMGILVSRVRMMTDDFKLSNRAKGWIKAIKGHINLN